MDEFAPNKPNYRKAAFLLAVLASLGYAFWPEIRTLSQLGLAFLQVFYDPQAPPLPLDGAAVRAFLVLATTAVGLFSFLWLMSALVAQFILPVRTQQERKLIVGRLLGHLSGIHGPALFIKEGKQVARESELERQGPGIVMVDSCSALVIEGQPHFGYMALGAGSETEVNEAGGRTRFRPKVHVYGPGVVFTKPYDRIRGIADLRPQIRLRLAVRSSTRDGIEMATNVFAIFTLGQPPDILPVGYVGHQAPENLRVIRFKELPDMVLDESTQAWQKPKVISEFLDELDSEDKEEIHRFVQRHYDNPPPPAPQPKKNGEFLFDPQRVFAAIYSTARDVISDKTIDWTELPAMTAADIFRDMLAREVYEYLYEPTDPDPRQFPLRVLKANFSSRVRNQGVLAYQFIGCPNGEPLAENMTFDESLMIVFPPRELRTPKVLRTRGIKIVRAGFSELKPVERQVVRHTFFEHWASRWEQEASYTYADYDLEVRRIRARERAKSQRDMALSLGKVFEAGAHSKEALAIRVFQALESAASEAPTRRLLPAVTIDMLRNLRQLLLPPNDGDLSGKRPNPEEDINGKLSKKEED